MDLPTTFTELQEPHHLHYFKKQQMAVQYAFGKIVTQGLDLNVDAADPTSYPGTGNTWTSVVNRSITGSLVSCSYSSDFKGGIVFASPSASVQLPGTVANYGTGSFTIEMAFRPTQIQGIHYLVSKNSGSFPNWGVYLSGSGGSGKLFSFYNISSTVSCSVSSSATFVTGSNYFVDVQLQPSISASIIYNNGGLQAVNTGNGGGSLTTTGSFFLGNVSSSSSQAYSGSLFFTRIYQTETLVVPYYNYSLAKTRIQTTDKNPVLARILVVGGGGSAFGLSESTGGGGGGGFIERTIPIAATPTSYTAFVGNGGIVQSGTSSYFTLALPLFTAIGGGSGGTDSIAGGGSGGSGGGGGSRGGASPGQGTQGQGFAGGAGGSTFGQTGGGGGAGGTGSAYNASNGPDGGPGKSSDISGVLTYYAGGGGGIGGDGGIGGGGNGGIFSSTTGTAGTPNTGGGGGGAGGNGIRGAAGGSGIVIIRYAGPPIATGGTITSVGGDTIHTFTATGSSTFTVL